MNIILFLNFILLWCSVLKLETKSIRGDKIGTALLPQSVRFSILALNFSLTTNVSPIAPTCPCNEEFVVVIVVDCVNWHCLATLLLQIGSASAQVQTSNCADYRCGALRGIVCL